MSLLLQLIQAATLACWEECEAWQMLRRPSWSNLELSTLHISSPPSYPIVIFNCSRIACEPANENMCVMCLFNTFPLLLSSNMNKFHCERERENFRRNSSLFLTFKKFSKSNYSSCLWYVEYEMKARKSHENLSSRRSASENICGSLYAAGETYFCFWPCKFKTRRSPKTLLFFSFIDILCSSNFFRSIEAFLERIRCVFLNLF